MVVYANDLDVAVKAIRSALLNDSIFPGGVSNQIFFLRTTKTYTLPYAFIGLNADAQNNTSRVNMSDLRLLVKVVGKVEQYTQLSILAGRIFGVLHEVELGDASEGWYIWRSERIQIVAFPEIDAEVDYMHLGGIYRLRLSS